MTLLRVIACLAVSCPVLGAEAPLPFAKDLHSHGVTQDQLEALGDIMRQTVEQEQIAGCSFLVAHKGEVVFREAFAYADIESKRLVFGKEENANPPAWLAPYVRSLPPTKKELRRAKSARSK